MSVYRLKQISFQMLEWVSYLLYLQEGGAEAESLEVVDELMTNAEKRRGSLRPADADNAGEQQFRGPVVSASGRQVGLVGLPVEGASNGETDGVDEGRPEEGNGGGEEEEEGEGEGEEEEDQPAPPRSSSRVRPSSKVEQLTGRRRFSLPSVAEIKQWRGSQKVDEAGKEQKRHIRQLNVTTASSPAASAAMPANNPAACYADVDATANNVSDTLRKGSDAFVFRVLRWDPALEEEDDGEGGGGGGKGARPKRRGLVAAGKSLVKGAAGGGGGSSVRKPPPGASGTCWIEGELALVRDAVNESVPVYGPPDPAQVCAARGWPRPCSSCRRRRRPSPFVTP